MTSINNQDKQKAKAALESERKVSLLIVDRYNRVLVETADGYAFEPRSTDLQGAVVFDEAGADEAIQRIADQKQLTDVGPFNKRTVRDFKMEIIETYAEESDLSPRM
jgi:hypothetical protein